MANINDIQAIIVRQAFTPGDPAKSIDFSQFVGRSTPFDPDKIFKYNFIDGDNNKLLTDTDAGDETTGDVDKILYDGKQHSVTSLGIASIRIIYDDGSYSDTPAESIRLFALDNGDLVINPLDSARNNSNLKPVGRWASISIRSTKNVLEKTTMSAQDDQFVTCFARGTLIATGLGAVPVENLRQGDLVATADSGLQPIRWVGSRLLSADLLASAHKLRPIRILAGALGNGRPAADLIVSPQHRVLVGSRIVQRMFNTNEVLAPAKSLLDLDGVEVANDMTSVEYFHMLFDRHEVIFSNETKTESMHTGVQALRSISQTAQQEIFAIFPELRDQDPVKARAGARMLLPGRRARQLIARHIKNRHVLI